MSELWVFPTPKHSTWFAKMDWYLNWQMTRGLSHEARRASAELLRLVNEHGLPTPAVTAPSSTPLLISSQGRVDAEQCLVLDFHQSLPQWLDEAHQLAQKLGQTNLRVFLPAEAMQREAIDLWKKLAKNSNLTADFLPDEDAAKWSTPFKKN